MLQLYHCQTYHNSETLFYQDLQKERSEAFTCLYIQTYQLCLPFALNKGSNQEEAEDLLQECLAIFIDKLRDGTYIFQEGAKITTYFYRIYVNQWKKSFEQKSKRSEVRLLLNHDEEQDEDDSHSKDWNPSSFIAVFSNEDKNEEILKLNNKSIFDDYDEDERSWIFKKLNRSFKLLAEDCQKVLHWFYVEDWSLRQIAQELGMTEASASVKRFKCAKYLKEKFRIA